jgi:hypothetical protein
MSERRVTYITLSMNRRRYRQLSVLKPDVKSNRLERFEMVSRYALAAGAVFLLSGALPAFAADRNVDVVNESSKAIKGFYASRTGLKSWEENIIKGDPIKSGETQPVDIDDGTGGCKFDFKAVFADGHEAVNENVDVCAISSVTYK